MPCRQIEHDIEWPDRFLSEFCHFCQLMDFSGPFKCYPKARMEFVRLPLSRLAADVGFLFQAAETDY